METAADPKTLLKSFAANVRCLRRQRKLSQLDLAEASGMSRITLNRIENARHMPGFDSAVAIADALKVPTDSLRKPL